MELGIGIYDSHILLRHPPSLAPHLKLVKEISSYYPCECARTVCAFPSHRNEFLPTNGVIHVRPENPLKVASFFGRALRNYYGPNTKRFALFHASAVSDGGGGTVFLGYHAWGKSTVLRGFVRSGYRYLSDDMASVGIGDGLLYPTLPVDPSIPSLSPSPPVPPKRVFIVRYLPEGDTLIERMDWYEAYLFAMENLLNPGAISDTALSTLIGVFSSAETYRALYRDWRDVLNFVRGSI